MPDPDESDGDSDEPSPADESDFQWGESGAGSDDAGQSDDGEGSGAEDASEETDGDTAEEGSSADETAEEEAAGKDETEDSADHETGDEQQADAPDDESGEDTQPDEGTPDRRVTERPGDDRWSPEDVEGDPTDEDWQHEPEDDDWWDADEERPEASERDGDDAEGQDDVSQTGGTHGYGGGGGRTAPPSGEASGNPERRRGSDADGDAADGDGDESGGSGRSRYRPSTAPDDEEMPLTEHVEEMALRFMAVGLVAVGIGGITLIYAAEVINFLWYSFIGPGIETCYPVNPSCPQWPRPRVYHPLALLLARFKVATLVGFIGALPVAVYQTYRFMRPGLYPRERRYYLAAVPTSLVLASVGISLAYFAVLPTLFDYFTSYTQRAAIPAYGLTETFNLIVMMLGFFALIFQIPLLVMLAIMMGVTTRRWLQDRRIYFWAGFAAIAFVFSPDPTGMAPLMVAVTMIALFEGTLLLLRWTDEGVFRPTASGMRANRRSAWVAVLVIGYLVSGLPAPTGYFQFLPGLVQSLILENDFVGYLPFLITGIVIALYEGAIMLAAQLGRLRVQLTMLRGRRAAWVVAVVLGYLGTPVPPLLDEVGGVALTNVQTAAVVVGLAVTYEVLILLLARYDA